jgi:putative phosphoesterase
VFSDSHGEVEIMAEVLESWRPELALHLGDLERDAYALEKRFPRISFKIVRGNCDSSALSNLNELFFCDQVKIFMTHGHRYQVKNGLNALYEAGRSAGADLTLFGHTHKAYWDNNSGMYVLNPGSVCGNTSPASWAQVEIDGKMIQSRIVPFF